MEVNDLERSASQSIQEFIGIVAMQPASAFDFLRAARQRMDVSEEIFNRLRRNLEAQYLAGYVIECSLKAVILRLTPAAETAEKIKQLRQGAKWHNAEILLGELRNSGGDCPLNLVKKLRWSTWTPGLRYESGRLDTGETRAFLKTAKLFCEWAEREMS